jgi:AcrR family transcriptional regulator
MTPTVKNGNPETRQSILDALDRLLQHHVLDDVGVSEILREAGLSSRTTYYQHFGSRGEAFIALAVHALDEIGAEVTRALNDPNIRSSIQLRAAADGWIIRGARHRGLTRSLITEWPRIPELKTVYLASLGQLSTHLATAIDEDRSAGRVVTPTDSPALAAMVLWSAERSIYAAMAGATGFADPSAVADTLVAGYLSLIYGVSLPPTP